MGMLVAFKEHEDSSFFIVVTMCFVTNGITCVTSVLHWLSSHTSFSLVHIYSSPTGQFWPYLPHNEFSYFRCETHARILFDAVDMKIHTFHFHENSYELFKFFRKVWIVFMNSSRVFWCFCFDLYEVIFVLLKEVFPFFKRPNFKYLMNFEFHVKS